MDSLPADQDVRTVIERELWLLRPQVRAAPGEVAALLHPQFREFGASGRRWSQADMITALAAGEPAAGEPGGEEPGGEEPGGEEPGGEEPGITATEMAATRLADDVIHLTYVSQRGDRRARRSSIWLRTPDGWRVYFHQGTLIQAP